jgi:penicillin-binding protein 1B
MTSRPRRVGVRLRVPGIWRHRWVRVLALAPLVPLVALLSAAGYYYVTFSRVIDARLHGERVRVLPRVFARPFELRRGQALTDLQLVDRLNDLGYTQRADPRKPGEFALVDGAVTIMGRTPEAAGRPIRVEFKPRPGPRASRRRPPPKAADHVERLELADGIRDRILLDAPLLTAISGGQREKRRPVALHAIPARVTQAVLAIEDRRFYDHPGVDVIRSLGAIVTNLRGDRPYLVGGSTITQQLVKNFFLTPEKSLRRKVLEQFMALVLERRATKDEILELYLNDIPLGQRGSFAIRGVSEAARLFFGKDITNVSLAEAATIAGVIQSPSALSPFSHMERCRERRNVVLRAMADSGYASQAEAETAMAQPLTIVQRALEAEAPHFVDYVGQTLEREYPGITETTHETVDVYTTLDLHLQRLAMDAVRDGLARVDQTLARRKRKGRAEAALLAVDSRTGDILAMIGGRFYNQSQLNRAVTARRQPGSVFKPFVYLAAFERGATPELEALTPASIVDDSPYTWETDEGPWTPENYEEHYDGPITLRRALAHSRNVAAVKVAELVGFGQVAALWKKLGVGGQPPRGYPSIALGVFEATPLEITTAYTIFPNSGAVRPLRHIERIERGSLDVTRTPAAAPAAVASPEATYLVTSMMRSVVNEGTGASIRGEGFALDAAGKTGTTNDLRDAWFAGFTPELLTVVWVGFDDNQPLGLSGSQAALPIWTAFMKRALAGYASMPFEAPDGLTMVEIDPDTGHLRTPLCPRGLTEWFVAGTEPTRECDHQSEPAAVAGEGPAREPLVVAPGPPVL